MRTHQIPQPFSGMTVFENVFVAATNGGRFQREEANDARSRRSNFAACCASPTGAPKRSACSTASGSNWRARSAPIPSVLLLDEIGGGLTDGEAGELVETIRSLQASGIAIVWIEHIVHVLLQVAERLICMDAGRIIADGDPRAVMADQAVISAYLGGSVH